jgi:glycosyltransferase involved in cell wall biosynthesis
VVELKLNNLPSRSVAGDTLSRHPFVSIIMPALNEEEAIGKVLLDVVAIMKSMSMPFEVIVVDDCSIDKTVSVAENSGATVLSNGENRGKGYCLRKGLLKAKGDFIVTMDSDGEHRAADVVRLLKPALKGVDVVAGSRFICATKNCTSRFHILGNHFFNICIMLLTGRRVTDSQTGFRVMKRSVVDDLRLESDGYEIESEITIKSLKNGFSFKEVPITIRRREYGITRIKMLSDGTKILRTIFVSSLSDFAH